MSRAAQITGAVLGVLTLAALFAPWPLRVAALLLTAHVAIAGALAAIAPSGEEGLRGRLSQWLILLTVARSAAVLAVARGLLAWRPEEAPFASAISPASAAGAAVAFVLLALVSLLVIGSGGVRVAEVAARFVLDALPGRQLGLDTTVQMGAVESEAAAEQLERIEQEAHFYGAMDGAMRVIRAEAVALVVACLVTVGAAAALHRVQYLAISVTALVAFSLLLIACLLCATAGLSAVTTALSYAARPPGDHSAATAEWVCWLIAAGGMVAIALTWQQLWTIFPLLGILVSGLWLASRPAKATEESQGHSYAGVVVLCSPSLLNHIQLHRPDFADAVRKLSSRRLGFDIGPVELKPSDRAAGDEAVVVVRGIEAGRWRAHPGHSLTLSEEGAEVGGDVAPDGRPARWQNQAEASQDSLPWHEVLVWAVVRFIVQYAELIATHEVASQWTVQVRAALARSGISTVSAAISWTMNRARELLGRGLPLPPVQLWADVAVLSDADEQRRLLRRLSLQYLVSQAGGHLLARQLHPSGQYLLADLAAGEAVSEELEHLRREVIAASWQRPHWLWPMLVTCKDAAETLAHLFADRLAEIVVVSPEELPPTLSIPVLEVPDIGRGTNQEQTP